MRVENTLSLSLRRTDPSKVNLSENVIIGSTIDPNVSSVPKRSRLSSQKFRTSEGTDTTVTHPPETKRGVSREGPGEVTRVL